MRNGLNPLHSTNFINSNHWGFGMENERTLDIERNSEDDQFLMFQIEDGSIGMNQFESIVVDRHCKMLFHIFCRYFFTANRIAIL